MTINKDDAEEYFRILIRPLAEGDAPALLQLYNHRNDASRRTFRGLGGETTDLAACQKVVDLACAGQTTIDLVAVDPQGAPEVPFRSEVLFRFVGWCFVWRLEQEENVFGLLVADQMQGRGLGRRLSQAVLAETDRRAIPVVHLTVVTDNAPAIHLYRSLGFVETGSFRGEDGLDYYRMQRRMM
jgi:ribosomal protein S18 acetylase RimI-like enzyme